MKTRVRVAAAVAVGVMAAPTGCSSGSDSSGASSPSTSTVTVTSSPAATTTATTADASTAPSPGLPGTRTSVNSAGAQPCRAADLSGTVSIDTGGGAAGSEYGTLALTNTGSTVCTVTGYPGVSFVGDGNGTQLGAAAARDNSTVVTASIEPRSVATARLRVAEGAVSTGCDPVRADGLRIYPPGDRDSIFVRTTSFTACRSADAHILIIGPLH